MNLKKARVGFGGMVSFLMLCGLTTGDILSAGYWYFIGILVVGYILIDMTTAAAAVGFSGVALQESKSPSMVSFERWCLGLSMLAWAGVLTFDVYAFAGKQWSPIIANILTAISIGIFIKFLDVEWTLMGSNFKKEWWGVFSIGFIISCISAFGITNTPINELWAISMAKLFLSLGISILFALSSKFIDVKIGMYQDSSRS